MTSFIKKVFAVVVVVALVAVMGIGVLALYKMRQGTPPRRDVRHACAMLTQMAAVSNLHLTRMLVSAREILRFDKDGSINPSGKLFIDYVGVATVDAYIPLGMVRVTENETNQSVAVVIPAIEVSEATLDENASFTWRNHARKLNQAVTVAAHAVARRSRDKAIELGIKQDAAANAVMFFTEFYELAGYATVTVQVCDAPITANSQER